MAGATTTSWRKQTRAEASASPAQFRLYFKYVLPVIVLIIFIMGYWDKFKPFIVAALGA